jgi:hypothetical protein
VNNVLLRQGWARCFATLLSAPLMVTCPLIFAEIHLQPLIVTCVLKFGEMPPQVDRLFTPCSMKDGLGSLNLNAQDVFLLVKIESSNTFVFSRDKSNSFLLCTTDGVILFF